MRKIPTIFERDWDGDRSRVLDIPNPEADWVFRGEGVATRKYDGMCCLFDGVGWWKRREVKKDGSTPKEFACVETDDKTGKCVGWVPIGGGPEDKYMREAIALSDCRTSGTYEFLGPKSQGNIEGYAKHLMLPHGNTEIIAPIVPRTFAELAIWFQDQDIEGIVWHHLADGRMAKIKKRDFGLPRKPVE